MEMRHADFETHAVSDRENAGHAFRGEYLHLCAKVETWASGALLKRAATGAKLPHLFGHKIAAVERLLEEEPGTFRKPAAVKERLERFKPFAEMRGNLSHARMTVCDRAGETIFLFELCPQNGASPFPQRFFLTQGEINRYAGQLRKVVKELCDQKTRS